MAKAILAVVAGVALLWLFQPTYSQFDHWYWWLPQLLAIVSGVGLLCYGIIEAWRLT